jgi:hypothetical protein
MELESLRHAWYSMEVKPATGQDPQQILALLKKRSQGPIAIMKGNLLRELRLVIIVYSLGIGYYFFGYDGKLSGIAWMLFTLLVIFAGYFYRKNRLLEEMQCVSCQVKSNMERQVGTLKKYIRFYVIAGTVMFPVMVSFVHIITQSKFSPAPGAALYYRITDSPWWRNDWWRSNISWILAMIPLTIGIYFVNVWYAGKLYGRNIKKLQEILKEMDEP